MVQELKRANGRDTEQNEKTLDFKSMSKAVNGKIKADPKPALVEPIEAIVKSAEVKIETDKYERNLNDETAIYHPGYVVIETEFEHPKTGELTTSKDYFRGFRAYLALDETLTPRLDEDGDEIISRYYAGTDKSRLRKIVNTLLASNKEINDYGELFYQYLPGLKVMIQSEFNTNPQTGENTVKQYIKEVIGK